MKPLPAISLLLAGIALPACAQRGGGAHGGAHGGGFSGHPSAGFHSGFNSSATPHFTGSMPAARPSGFRSSPPGYRIPRPGYPGINRFRTPYNTRFIGAYGYVGSNGLDYPGYVGTPDDSANGDGYDQPAQPQQGQYQLNNPEYDQQQALPPPPQYAARPAPAPPPAAYTGTAEAVTLVFKDGRPTEQIHNYMMTRSTLYVRDLHPREIPLADLDLAATQKLSREAGADFQPPR